MNSVRTANSIDNMIIINAFSLKKYTPAMVAGIKAAITYHIILFTLSLSLKNNLSQKTKQLEARLSEAELQKNTTFEEKQQLEEEKDWIDKLSLLVRDKGLRREMGMKGRSLVVESYSVQSNFEKFHKVLKNVKGP